MLQQEKDKGWLLWKPTLRQLENQVGPVTLNKIGVIAKQVNEVTKLRLIHDLKRSGVNQRVVITERVILPRLSDLVEDLLTLIKKPWY